MAVDLYPFQDVRMRQAMRLIANRPQLVEEAQEGYGQIGNDIAGKGLPGYDATIAQRVQDIDQAKFLIKQAGHEGMNLTLYSSTVATGMLESATVFATEASQANFTVTVKELSGRHLLRPGLSEAELRPVGVVLAAARHALVPVHGARSGVQ